MGGVGDFRQRGQVVDPIQARLVGERVHTAEQQVDLVGFPAAEGAGDFAAHEGRDGAGAEGAAVAHAVELDVGLDVFCELDCSWRAR